MFVLFPWASGCDGERRGETVAWDVVARYPHDPAAYTQGLAWADSVLYESTGRYGHSELRLVDLRSGRVLVRHRLANDRYGEGLALLDGTLYQLTWREGIAYSYAAATLAPVDSFRYAGEGWGLTTDGSSLILSDGSDSLRILSPSTFEVERVVPVRLDGAPLRNLNELEYVDGDVLANVHGTVLVVRIEMATGEVTQVIDFRELYPGRARGELMNGIARGSAPGHLLVTGKLWPGMYEVRISNDAGVGRE